MNMWISIVLLAWLYDVLTQTAPYVLVVYMTNEVYEYVD